MAKLDAFYCKKNDSDFKLLKKNKRINEINGRNRCNCIIKMLVSYTVKSCDILSQTNNTTKFKLLRLFEILRFLILHVGYIFYIIF